MKEKYFKPSSEIELFSAVSVLTTSGGDDGSIELPDFPPEG